MSEIVILSDISTSVKKIKSRGKVFLPIILNTDLATPDIFNNPKAYQAYLLIAHNKEQKRSVINPLKSMSDGAQYKATDLGVRGYFSHTSPDGVTPNQLARSYSVPLSPSYPDIGNNIESLVAGTDDPKIAIDALLNSDRHREHLLGLKDYYLDQNSIGIGYQEIAFSPFRFYWSIWIGKVE